MLVGIAALWVARADRRAVTSPAEYQALTDVADSATAPVLSPDGRLLAFIRNGEWLLGSGQVWLKALPDGESVQLTKATGLLFAPAFNADGTRVSYTVVDRRGESWDTWTVPVTGGEPTRLLPNASGLTWIGPHEVMYSEFKAGVHLGVVESQDTRAGHRDIYWPAHERAMAHFSWLSPDRRNVLVAGMDGTGSFRQCRLVPFGGASEGALVGPPNGACVSAAWSIDGQWMYFSARVAGHSHLWRQRFPDGAPEQITFGPSDEETVFAAPDGHSLLTSIGAGQDALWLHARDGERALTTEGSAFSPWLSGDGRRAYFLSADNVASAVLLTRIDVATGRREVLLPSMSVADFDVSPDEQQVVLAVKRDGVPDVWLAPLDRHAAPRLLVHQADQPRFGGGKVYFRKLDGKADYLERIDPDGTHEDRVLASPIVNFDAVAPDGRFAAIDRPVAGGVAASWLASTQDEGEHMIGHGWFPSHWSRDGRWLFLEIGLESDSTTPGRTAVLRLDAGGLPAFPVLPLAADTQIVARPEDGLSFGPDPSTYVYVRSEGRRNIYRIPLH
jgi:Tol biopolymer transport system component